MRPPAMLRWAAAALALLAAAPAAAFYLPGVAPNDFQKKDLLLVKVNKLTSTKTQLPYSYYSLPFCKPDTIVDSAENLGEVLRGDRIENSPYVFEMREPKMCQIVCRASIDDKQAKELKEKIGHEYRDRDAVVYQGGYHVGVKGQYAGSKDEKVFIHNHLTFLVKYHKDETTELSRIVGFEESDVKWASRWDTYLLITDDQIHWFSIVNSLMIVLFLSGMVAMIMLRTLYRDISSIFFIPNALIWGEKSCGAVPFTTMFALVLLWFGISVPLVFVGSYLGFKQPAIEAPVKINKIPRQVPEQAWYMNPAFTILIGGILPFGAVFIELFFILTSIWLHQFYYIFGFLFLVFIILIITCAEITIVLCYFQLCSEDYNWWWRSYLTSGSSAIYLFLYAGWVSTNI
ncbi:transmembrane 9 superfamily member 8 [Panicum miliaceum]|uniref:Transmembrane 9 superfamily member n=1 Tax=Panicum miliaceum TaxID=4540 RepID=A0A3L6PQR6_PANMI|nr:transmembrane 9 superfamily member 8 [Panicum miliaceum]